MAASTPSKGKQIEDWEVGTSEDEQEEVEGWDDWNVDEDDENESDSKFICLFCDSLFGSCDSLFKHCVANHHFDFQCVKKNLGLDFYGAFKLINYVRQMVAENRCWSCGLICESKGALQNHLHRTDISKDMKLLWDDDKYLVPSLQGDSLLYSFDEDEDCEDDENVTSISKEELMSEFRNMELVRIDGETNLEFVPGSITANGNGRKGLASACNGLLDIASSSNKEFGKGFDANKIDDYSKEHSDKNIKASFAKVVALEIRKVNESYFGSYSSFGIHREMLSDKARMDAYSQAILRNPSLLKGAVVMDVGCGTGILSLFAAKAGALRVIAVDASQKMVATASQIAKDNGLLWNENSQAGIIKVVHAMVEELDKSMHIKPRSVDVLVSEWMGYCLLYESMLSSVLFARDQWLKPGGAILPDTATMFAAGFGRGGTSLPFWENVCGFDLSCVGKELVEDAAKFPIVDVVDSCDIVTETVVLQTFDLVSMKLEDMDFTTVIELEPKSSNSTSATWCHGMVLWFETDFTTRFCKEAPAVLSTSPYLPKTHWQQTILTFKEPIALSSLSSSKMPNPDRAALVGTHARPALKIQLRVSIARAAQYRAIDISLETTGVGRDGRKHHFPPQIFNLS